MTNQFQVTVAAATAVLNYDLLMGEKFAQASYARKLVEFAIVGSAAIGDCGVEIWAGEARKGQFYNSSAGANLIPKDYDRKYPNAFIPANAQVMVKVIDAPASNPVVIELTFSTGRRSTMGLSRGYGYRASSGIGGWRPSARFPTRASWQATRR